VRRGQREHRREDDGDPEDRHRIELARVGPEHRHQSQIMVGVPEPRARAGVRVRQARAGEEKRDDSQQKGENAALRHGRYINTIGSGLQVIAGL
jgi:hypothetical protein